MSNELIKQKLRLIGQWVKIIENLELTPPEQARVNSAFVLLKNLIQDRMNVG